MLKVPLVLLGPGKIGRTFLRQYLETQDAIKKQYGIKLIVSGIFDSRGGITDRNGISSKAIEAVVQNGLKEEKNYTVEKPVIDHISQLSSPFVVIDTTASQNTVPILLKILKIGGYAVLSNKYPLSSDLTTYKALTNYENQLFYETTVGAGLPIISTLREMNETGDRILKIDGCFSGTLGVVFSLMQSNKTFSESVHIAFENGFTEPDPRNDLSCLDFARKVLIVSRIMGQNISLQDISIQSLYPKKMDSYTIDQFLTSIKSLDERYRKVTSAAKKRGETIRCVASVTLTGHTVGLKEVELDSDFGTLRGPDNIIQIATNRYNNNPMVIKGPGAGVAVTAAGVLGDVLKIVKIIAGK